MEKKKRRLGDPGFGKRLKIARARLGWSQKTLAAAAGVTAGAISKYEAGRKPNDPLTAARLAEVLRVRFDWLLRGESGGSPEIRETGESNQVGTAGYIEELGLLLAGTPLEDVLNECPPVPPEEHPDRLWSAMSKDAKDQLRRYVRTLATLSTVATRKSSRLYLDLEALARIVLIVTRDRLRSAVS